jgi:phospholipid/cholesterol/gamma-HCH transport system substrate-binding protein
MFQRLKRPIEGYNGIWLGTLAVALAVVVVAGVLGIGRLPLGQTVYQGEFLQAAQIRPGELVTVAGIRVGTVNGVKLAGDRVVVEFKVDNEVHLGRDTRAAIKLTTLLGSRYVELSPAGGGDLDHRTIRLANTSVPYDLQKTLADATTTFEQVDADRIAESMTTLAHGLTGVPEALPQALDNVKSLAAIISERRSQIGSLLSSVDTITAMIRNQQANLGSLVLQGRNLLAEIVARREAVEQLFASATALVNTVKTTLGDQPAMDKMLADLDELTRVLAEKNAMLRSFLQIMPVVFRNLTNATGSGNAVEVNLPAGIMIDSWMCAISARAIQFNLAPYYTDCAPSADPFPGWPPPDPARAPR